MSGDQGSGLVARKLPERSAKDSPKPTTPFTPTSRFISSNYSSPGSTFGKEEDAIILEINQRFLQAGIEGESCPQCKIAFTPQGARRVGDYRPWIPGYVKKEESFETWGEGHELWRNNLNNLDLGLVGDKLERVVREAYNKHLLVDAGNARLVLVVPSLLPHPVLSVFLKTLFERWNYSSITLLPTPTMAVIGSGLRSGLVVDIGWEETTITAVYEYREVDTYRTTRAMKVLTKQMAEYMVSKHAQKDNSASFTPTLETVEDILYRISDSVISSLLNEESEPQDAKSSHVSVEIPSQASSSPMDLDIAEVSSLISDTLTSTSEDVYPDDHELPVDKLLFQALLSLPTDVRSLCISRIIFAGTCTDMPSLSKLILRKFTNVLEDTGWNKVNGKIIKQNRKGLTELAQTRASPPDARHHQAVSNGRELVEERYLRDKAKASQQVLHGDIREVETLGSWAGASLLINLKIKGFVEVQQERFLSHGLSSASRDADISVIPQQRSSGLATRSKPAGERTSWSLAGWA